MNSLEKSIELAKAKGYLPLSPNQKWLSPIPDWLESIKSEEEFGAFEKKLKIKIPNSVKQFWINTDLVRLLDSWRWQDYLSEQPQIIKWGNLSYLLVCSHPHSGGIGAVLLNGEDDPILFWGWEEEENFYKSSELKFSDHIYLAIEHGE